MKKFSKILSVLLCLAMVLGLAAVVGAEGENPTYTKVTSATLTSGQYVMIVDTGYAPGVFDNGWVTPVQPTVSNDVVTDAKGAVWTLTVDGTNVKLTDANDVTIAPKSGEKNGIQAADYNWAWSYADGKFTFAGQGKDTSTFACNTDAINGLNRFRSYKNKTVSGDTTTYRATFTLYKLDETSSGGEHEHDYTGVTPTVTVVDGVNHSYSYTCTDSSCDNVKTETEAHTFGADGKCTVCKFEYTGISQILTAKAGSWTATGVVTFVSGKNVYIQDSTGGICLYCSAAPTDISVGDVVTGTGSYKLFKGLPELENVASVTKVTGSDLKLTPKATTIGALTEADICTYVKIEGATVTAIEGDYTTIKQGENTINIYKAKTASTLKVGDTLNLTVAVGCFNDLQLVNCKDSEIVVTSNANPGEGEDNPPASNTYTGTLLPSLKDGDEVVIYSDYLKGLMTYEDSVYNDKHQLKSTSATVADGKVSYKDGAIVLTVHVKDNVYSFTTPSGLYLYVDGTHTMFVSEAGENTQFVLEQAEGGFYVKCATATYNDKPQYLEAYKGVFTTFGMNENNAAQYVFQFYSADPETPRTGDTSLSMLVALMAVSALGIVVVTSKKKEF